MDSSFTTEAQLVLDNILPKVNNLSRYPVSAVSFYIKIGNIGNIDSNRLFGLGQISNIGISQVISDILSAVHIGACDISNHALL